MEDQSACGETYSIFGMTVNRKHPSSGFFLKKKPLCTLLEKSTLIPKMP
jgi:hypothetical protein